MVAFAPALALVLAFLPQQEPAPARGGADQPAPQQEPSATQPAPATQPANAPAPTTTATQPPTAIPPGPLPGRQQPPTAVPPATAPGARAGQPQQPASGLQVTQEGDDYVFNFEAVAGPDGVPLKDFVNMCNTITKIPFYIRKEVETKLAQQKVNIIGMKRVPVVRFYDFFQSLLKINDLVLVLEGGPESGVWQIADLKGQDRNVIKNSARYISPEEIQQYAAQPGILLTTVLALQYANAREISASLRPLFPDNQIETVISLGNTNGLLVTGFGPTVSNLQQLMRLIDTPPSEPKPIFEVIQVEHASADELVQILDDLIEKRRPGAATPAATGVSGAQIAGQAPELKIRADGRSNTLLVVGLQDDVQQVLEIVARVDKAQPEPESDFHVYTLKNVKSVDFAKVLTDFIDKSHQAVTTGAPTQTGGGRGGTTATPSSGGQRESKPVVVADESSN
ncbi:MAG TPA: secretin N-terminal domain-containing protein, partial [Planctomycetota bacterium]|nr:secretin N-terminal domain-containing protein [Planctomycetota bacterium]